VPLAVVSAQAAEAVTTADGISESGGFVLNATPMQVASMHRRPGATMQLRPSASLHRQAQYSAYYLTLHAKTECQTKLEARYEPRPRHTG
jgi:hypothetical protein